MDGDTPRYLVLGPVAALDTDATPIDLGGAQRRAVLAKLVLSVGRVLTVETIADGLWPGEPPPSAKRSLEAVVAKLKKLLPDGDVATHRPGYSLQVPAALTDVGRFEDLVAEAGVHGARGEHEAATALLRAALALWRGPALSGLGAYPFVAGPMARLDEARRQATEARIEADLALGRHAEVVGDLEGMVHDEPLREPLWALLMTALYRSGRQGDALDAYARARQHLLEQLGLDPGPDLRRLEVEILRQTLPDAPGAAVVAPAVQQGTTPPSALGRSRAPEQVVGREHHLADLARVMDEVRAGRGSVVAVRGDEGLGKTTLLRAFADQLDDDALVLAGRAREHLVAPYGPWVELLQPVADGELTHLLSGAQDDPRSLGGDGETPERRRDRLIDGVVQALRGAAQERPVVVVLDDLQWSDDASILLLLHAVDELADDRVLLLAAWRDREVVVGHPAMRFAHLAARRGRLAVDLAPLRPSDVADLLARSPLTGDDVRQRAVAGEIHRSTSGVPLFVADAVGLLVSSHDALPEPDEVASAIPETVRTLVARRMGQAGPGAAEVVEACAVLTDPFAPEVVQQLVPDLGLATVLDALDHLVEVGLLQEPPEGFGFQHVAFRHAVDGEMRSGRRQMLHAGAHQAFRRAGAPPAVLVHHAETAGPLVSRLDLLRDLHDAAEDASRRGAFVDAATFLGRAVVLSEAHDRAPLHVAHADALWRAGDISSAKAIAAEVVTLGMDGENQVSDEVLTDAVVLHGTFGAGYGVDLTSLAAAEAALDVVQDPVQRARLRTVVAYQHGTWGSPQPVALEAIEHAKAALPEPCPDEVTAEVLFTEAQALLGSPDLARRRGVSDDLVALGHRTGSWRDVGRGLRMRAFVLMSAGDLDEVERTLDEILDVADRTGSWMYRADAWRWRTTTALARGDDAAALAGLAELERIGASPLAGRAFVGSQWPLLHWVRGEHEESLRQVELLRAALPEDPLDAPDRRMVDLFRLLLLAEAGRRDEAEAELHRMAPHRTLELASCRRYPAELALTADLAAGFGLVEAMPELEARLVPFSGQLLVLSWGEVLLGAADRYLAELRSLQTGILDEAGFTRALQVEERAGAATAASRTKLRRERTIAALTEGTPP